MKQVLFLFAFIFFCSFKKEENQPIHEWTRYELSFADFKGKADQDKNIEAHSECGINYEMYVENDSAYIRIVAVFNRKKSWIREQTQEALNHEQGHFNICERSVRMFRKKLLNYNGEFTAKNIESKMNQLMDEASESNRMNQDMYENSLNDVRIQNYWDKLIIADINQLEDYSSKLIVIALKEEGNTTAAR